MQAIDWERIDLAVFDVDGTLYDAHRLRRAMLGRLLLDAAARRSTRTLRILRAFRNIREELGDEQPTGFDELQYTRTASQAGCTADEVRALVSEWMEQRPLPLLAACRYPHIDRVFDALRAAGKQVAVLSDYPAVAKLAALGLQAHPVVSATDADISALKPNPAGLRAILERTGVPASRALMIGDRIDRDAAVAWQAGVQALIRTRKPDARVATFRRFDDPVFQPLLAPQAAPGMQVLAG